MLVVHGSARRPSGRRAPAVGLAVLLLTVSACGPNRGDAPLDRNGGSDTAVFSDLFEERASDSGVDFTYRNGEEADHYTMLETLGGGVGLLDYDGDGRLDVFLTGGGFFDGPDRKQIQGLPCKLYRNLGGWKFRDVTAAVGLDTLPRFYTHGCAVGDYDRDGWPDLLATGWGRLALFRNEDDGKGGRRFVDVTESAGLGGVRPWSTSAAWGDLDGDGYPELYICHYVNWSWAHHPVCKGDGTAVPRDTCSPRLFDALPDVLYHNVPGDGPGGRRLIEVTQEAGLRVPVRAEKDYGKGLGVLLVDVNSDGKPDIYVANDTTDNFLYLNDSRPGQLRFQDVGFPLCVARDGSGTPNGSMGVAAADFDGRGLPSLWVTNYEGELHGLYRNVIQDGRQFFQFRTAPAGIAAIGRGYVGFGTGFLDFDLDGWEDLVISNGHVLRHPSRSTLAQRPVLLRNLGTGRFANLTDQGGAYFRAVHRGRGLAVGDLDNDGRPDLVISHVNAPVVLLRNVAEPRPWLGVELAARDHGDPTGVKVTLEVGDRCLTRFSQGGGSYLSAGDRRVRFGLGTSDPAARLRLTVEWSSGEPRCQSWEHLIPGRYWRCTQGEPMARQAQGWRPEAN